MKKIFFTLLVLLFSATLFSQTTALEKVAKETCEYFQENEEELSKLSSNERVAKLGLQMFVLYDKYRDELKAEGIDVDISDENSGEAFGEKVGMKMVNYCADVLMLIAEDVTEEDGETEFTMEGTLVNVYGDDLAKVSIKDTKGKVHKFIWINNFIGSEALINVEELNGKSVKVYYKNVEIYSPKLKEYIVKKQISKIEYL